MRSTVEPRTTFLSRLTFKGQVTIPVEIRRRLGLKHGDKVAFVEDGETITLRPAGSITERTAGALAQYRRVPPLTADEERRAFAQAVADETAESSDR